MSSLAPSPILDCSLCGTRLRKGKYRCHSCGAFNIADESPKFDAKNDGTILLSDVTTIRTPRIRTGPWDRNFGFCGKEKPHSNCGKCGLAINSVTLLSGAPGVGKSTICLQIGDSMAGATRKEILYVGAEEDAEQVKDRAIRLSLPNLNLIRIIPIENMADVSLDAILAARHEELCGVFVDSMPGFTDDPEEAVRIITHFKREFSAKYKIPMIVINHILKDGDAAGMMKLQHSPDATVEAEKGGPDEIFHVLDDGGDAVEMTGVITFRTKKNRNGPTGDLVDTHYIMTDEGLQFCELEEEEDDDDYED
jgi:DNA repair protein RadA/Sms